MVFVKSFFSIDLHPHFRFCSSLKIFRRKSSVIKVASLILFTYSRTSGRQVNSLYAPHIIRFQWSTLDSNTENRSFHVISIEFHVQTSHFSNSTCQNKKAANIQTFTNLRLTCGPLAGWRVQCPTWHMSANHIAQLTILGGNFPATWVVLDGKTLKEKQKFR